MRGKNYLVIFVFLILGCKKPYSLPTSSTNFNFIVVEGMINTGQDSTIIKLSRTVNTSAGITYNPELQAIIIVETNQNNSFQLGEKGNGKYVLPPINLGSAADYRLRIKTIDNAVYLSDFVQAKTSPPIDSVTNDFSGSSENFYVYTHDPANNTHFYRWEYEETYLYKSPISTNFIYKNGNIVTTNADDQISTCYIADTASTINIFSTANLSKDIINKNPITQVPVSLDKLKIRYSILVKQYALTPDAYHFYQKLKKNTETIGSIFDALPSLNITNIHCISNPGQVAVGFITAGTFTQKRIFVDRSVIPVAQIGVDYSYCGIAGIQWKGSIKLIPDFLKFGYDIPVSALNAGYDAAARDSIFSISYGSSDCVNCTLKGSNKKPAFWK